MANTPLERDEVFDMTVREFAIPTNRQMKATAVPPESLDEPCVYLCGNSLGLQPRRARRNVEQELDVWATRAVEGHFDHPHHDGWMTIADRTHASLAALVGADPSEVACMGTLTANLHLCLHTFYRPTPTRYKILCEARAFPSDQYAMASHVAAHGFDPADAVLELAPRPGAHTLAHADILAALAAHGPDIALVLFSGVQYYTGQLFDIPALTAAARAAGCTVGWDLAHAVGNVPLALHDSGADFAVWCSYKYLCAGPGAVAGLFVHARWADAPVRAAGWWGHDPATRFAMPPAFARVPGAQGLQQSNPGVLAVASLRGALDVFDSAGMPRLRARSLALTGALLARLRALPYFVELDAMRDGAQAARGKRVGLAVITPEDPAQRGAQLSLVFLPLGRGVMMHVKHGLARRGVIGDERKPDVLRLAPCPLYNSFQDVDRAADVLHGVLDEIDERGVGDDDAVKSVAEENKVEPLT